MTYKDWKKRQESLSYTFQQEIKQLLPEFNENFIVPKHQHPYALRLFLGEHISLDTLVILNDIIRFYSSWNKAMHDDIVWKEVGYQIPKYAPFLKILGHQQNRATFRDFLMEQFNG